MFIVAPPIYRTRFQYTNQRVYVYIGYCACVCNWSARYNVNVDVDHDHDYDAVGIVLYMAMGHKCVFVCVCFVVHDPVPHGVDVVAWLRIRSAYTDTQRIPGANNILCQCIGYPHSSHSFPSPRGRMNWRKFGTGRGHYRTLPLYSDRGVVFGN